MKAIIILFGILLTGVLAVLEVPTNYHDAIGIPLAKRIKALEEAILANETIIIEDRIIGGEVAPANAFPFFAGLLISLVGTPNQSVCGSTLLSANRVVTAAHCNFDGVLLASEFTVVLGSNFIHTGGKRIATSEVVMHPYFVPATINDVAILYLPENVVFTDIIHPIRLPDVSQLQNLFVGYKAMAIGFGSTTDKHQNTAENILSYVTLQVIDNADCEPLVVTPENICTSGIGPVGHIGICSGDSGGPLITLDSNGNPILIGITSFRSRAKGCEGGAPSGFTRVTSFMDFIISNLDTR
ncbi:collagenase-like [Spodoptera frugiperda]|uniref:Collagenase-like n=1 Tax=Spodoptera frugiperda TaxID=7108 RepID=A0A9R0DNE2_SPOFR|nr:collagenase-like [Spodoptera frugiperda]